MFLAGIDISGDPETDHYKRMSIVIGTKESIDSIVKRLGSNKIHMNQVKKHDHGNIISKLDFTNDQIIAFCITLDKKLIVDRIRKSRRIKQKNISSEKIFRMYNNILMYEIRESIVDFLSKHNHALSDIVFQCDQDCLNFAKDTGLRYTEVGDAHMLADIVAWANNKNIEPDGVIAMDLRDIIERRLKKELL